MNSDYRVILSPCVGVCTMSAEDALCDGCHRTSAEISRWIGMSDDERAHLMDTVLPERKRRRAAPQSSSMSISIPQLEAALYPLAAMPEGEGWNLQEVADLLPRQRRAAQAAVLVPLIPRHAGMQVLLTRRTDALRHHAGQVSFPGGRIEGDDAGPVAAALREAFEEIGLAAVQAEPLGFLDPLATITGFRVLPVVARIDPAFVAVPDPAEVSDIFEVPLDWLMARDNLQRIAIDYRGRPRRVLEFRRAPSAPTQRIWGATASILLNLRQRLEHAA